MPLPENQNEEYNIVSPVSIIHPLHLESENTSLTSLKHSRFFDDESMAPKRKAQRIIPPEREYIASLRVYSCNHCRTHLTCHEDLISKCFHGRHGRAFLFDNCVNVHRHSPEDRQLITGRHRVCDISCLHCNSIVGWTYIESYEESQRYKEGKFILEKIHLFTEQNYDNDFFQGAVMDKKDRFRRRAVSWGDDYHASSSIVYEYPML